jgi:hypothetical protein
MARLGVMYENRAAQRFRAAIRPSLVGQLKYIEQPIAVEAANALGLWMMRVVEATLRTTVLNDRKGEVAKQLRGGIRIYGRGSLVNLRSQIVAYPWLMAQEFGASIDPKERYLAIPIFDALRPDGSVKFQNPRSWNRFGSFVWTQRGTGKKFLVYKSKQDGGLKFLYVLVEHVDIKPVLGLIRNADAMLGQLMATWGQIYLAEATKPQYKLFDLWDGAYK